MAFDYVTKRGDTLYRIARQNGIMLGELMAANPQVEELDMIYPGQVIRIPDRTLRRYIIQQGDTLYDIGRRFKIALDDLLRANSGLDPRRLRVGTLIVLPPSRGMDVVSPAFPYGYVELREDMGLLKQRYPFLQTEVIGQSVLGKELIAAKLGNGTKRLHLNAAIHANEWITAAVLMKLLEDCCEAYATGRMLRGRPVGQWLETTSLWVVPMLNPDGIELVQEGITPQHPYYAQLLEWNNDSYDFSGWKANIHGVDLNDQFPAHWEEEKARRGVAGPGPRDYPGAAPLSEPEAIAIADYTTAANFQMVIAFHTQGQEIYYTYRGLEPPESAPLAERFAQVSTYRPVSNIESDAGYKDWFIQEYRRPGFTIESGLGVNPLPVSQFPEIYRQVSEIVLEALASTQ
ncbi:MAG: LysM peptidoglycan-binding domain-containing protein [Gorillibacterium sp.]|nr:LysM peptidoglycan-binding domain-containing protein [Gorillibacterium sp.]